MWRMETMLRDLITQLHSRPGRMVLVTAGAGSQALSWLLGVAGASRTLLEAVIPYDARAFDDFLGQTPRQYVSAGTARLLAGRALTRARQLRQPNEWVVGVSCTATIATDRPKRGEHRAHLAAWSPEFITTAFLQLHKGGRDRRGEEEMVSYLLLNMVAEAMGVTRSIPLLLQGDDQLYETRADLAGAARDLLAGRRPYFGIQADGYVRGVGTQPSVLLSGSFNPLHEGHTRLAEAAAQQLGRPVAFELSAANVDKPPLEEGVVLERLAQFAGRWPVYASPAATFAEKAALFPGATFVVGYDTAIRILDARYYHQSPAERDAALAGMRALGCRFLVAGRLDASGAFQPAETLPAPPHLADLFQPLPGFRHDISSTALRAEQVYP